MGINEFGDLNPRTINERYRKFSSETTGIKGIRDGAVQSNSTIKDSLKSKGNYIAEVLKVFTAAADQKAANAASGLNMWGSVESRPDNIVTIIARIPEIHHFCVPTNLPLEPKSDTYQRDAKIVDMYPRFVAERPGLPKPKPGQKVWVSFEDKINYHGGLYLGVVDEKEMVVPTYRAKTPKSSPKAASKKPKKVPKTPAEKIEKTIPKKIDDLSLLEKAEIASKFSTVEIKDAIKYKENRVRLFSFDQLAGDSSLLVPVPRKYKRNKSKNVRIHVLFLPRFIAMNEAWIKTPQSKGKYLQVTGGGTGWRKRRFTDYKTYEAFLRRKYGSISHGKKMIAYNSPHYTGLAIDLTHKRSLPKVKEGKHAGARRFQGILPISRPDQFKKTKKKPEGEMVRYGGIKPAQQRTSPVWKWLRDNAHKYGFTPYKAEPWHWELIVPRENYYNGKEFATDDRGYAVRVEETSNSEYPNNVVTPKKKNKNKGKKLKTTSKQFACVPFQGPCPEEFKL